MNFSFNLFDSFLLIPFVIFSIIIGITTQKFPQRILWLRSFLFKRFLLYMFSTGIFLKINNFFVQIWILVIFPLLRNLFEFIFKVGAGLCMVYSVLVGLFKQKIGFYVKDDLKFDFIMAPSYSQCDIPGG